SPSLPPPCHPSLYFSRSRPHPDLHSFPTRRSSDLGSRREPSTAPGYDKRVRPQCRIDVMARHRPAADAAHRKRHGTIGSSISMRSEEHTSELQSLAYLVCRLLLEKKKNRRATHHCA